MGQKLPANLLQLYKGIDEILWKDWDPIGVSPHGPRARIFCKFSVSVRATTWLTTASLRHNYGRRTCIYRGSISRMTCRIGLNKILEK